MQMMNSEQDEWVIITELAIAKHLPTGTVYRYLPDPRRPGHTKIYVVSAFGEYANLSNSQKQRIVNILGEQGKNLYLSTLGNES